MVLCIWNMWKIENWKAYPMCYFINFNSKCSSVAGKCSTLDRRLLLLCITFDDVMYCLVDDDTNISTEIRINNDKTCCFGYLESVCIIRKLDMQNVCWEFRRVTMWMSLRVDKNGTSRSLVTILLFIVHCSCTLEEVKE